MPASSVLPASIAIAAPIRPGVTSGNSVTSLRWSRLLGELGHRVEVVPVEEGVELDYLAPDADLIVVLHAHRCSQAVRAAKSERADRPVVVALAGTDLYRDLPESRQATEAVDAARALVVLQAHGLDRLASMNPRWRTKAHVIHQSVESNGLIHRPPTEGFTIAVLSHLRDVKDPLLAATASRLLPDSSEVKILHGGAAHTQQWEERARQEMAENPRYRWLGELDADASANLLANSHALACTSLLEGGANVVSEAIHQGVAVIGTDIGGNCGLLGDDHPGLIPVGDAEALARLLTNLEQNPAQLEGLIQRSVDRQWMVDPVNERERWQGLIEAVLAG